MTDRIRSLTVILNREIRIDDAEEGIIAAIKMIKGVADVQAHIFDTEQQIARYDGALEVKKKLYEFLETI